MIKQLYLIILILFIVSAVIGQSSSKQTTQKKERIALVIGNGNYIGSILANPENDARSMTDVLKKLGFIVYPYENLNQSQIKKVIDDFGQKLKGNEVGLFYYAGHGIQAKGFNYLIPVDAQVQTEEQVDYDCVRADRILSLMETSGTKINIIILDACRNNPFERSWTRSATGKGLAFMSAPQGTLIAYATAPGSTASDGSGKNGLYTSAILESISAPNITIEQMFKNVRNIVSQKSNNQQMPWESTSLTGEFYFNTDETLNLESTQIQLAPSTVENINEEKSIVINDGETYTSFIDTRDNKHYRAAKIGNQIWMSDDLKAASFNDGTSIPLVTDASLWKNLITPGYCLHDKAENEDNIGAFYNWFAVGTKKLCPSGWHIPNDEEWAILVENFGGKSIAGKKMKEPGNGFDAILAGIRFRGDFKSYGMMGTWWSATNDNSLSVMATSKGIFYKTFTATKSDGRQVRCIKDKNVP